MLELRARVRMTKVTTCPSSPLATTTLPLPHFPPDCDTPSAVRHRLSTSNTGRNEVTRSWTSPACPCGPLQVIRISSPPPPIAARWWWSSGRQYGAFTTSTDSTTGPLLHGPLTDSRSCDHLPHLHSSLATITLLSQELDVINWRRGRGRARGAARWSAPRPPPPSPPPWHKGRYY